MKFKHRLFICALALSGMALAMLPPEAPIQKQQLRIRNETLHKINVEFVSRGQKVTLPLFPKKDHVFSEPEKLTELYIEPYGQVRGYLSASVFTGGYWRHNYIDKVKSELYDASQTTPIRDVVMIINPSAKAPSASSWLGSIAQDILPFEIIYERHGREVPPISALLKEYFPEVNRAIGEKRTITAHDFLGLKVHASRQEVDSAYKSIHLQLISILESSLPKTSEETDFYRQALNFVEHAYRSISGGVAERNALNDLIQEHLVDIGGTIETIPTLYVEAASAASQS